MHREILPLLIVALMFAIALYADPLVKTNEQGEMVGHWGITGSPDGFVSKTVGLYLLPFIALIIYVGLLIIPEIEVYKKNIEEMSQQLLGFRVVLVFAMGVIYVATILPNLGFWGFEDPTIVIIPAIAMAFFYVGYMLNFSKRNYFIGIHTPWTLADEKIWDKTNKLGGKLFWISGALALVALVVPGDLRLWVVLGPVVAAALGASLYSLWLYRKTRGETSKGKKRRGK